MGMNQYGQLGLGVTAKSDDGSILPVTVPTLVSMDAPVVSIGCGSQHSMCTTSDGRLFVWGTGSVGQLGLGESDEDDNDVFLPKLLPTKNRTVIAADAGSQFTVILASEKSE